MKLALVHKRIGGGGGLETYVASLADRLASLGHELELICQECGPEVDWGTIHQLPKLPVFRTARLLKFDRDVATALGGLEVDHVLGFGQTTHQDVHRAGGGCHAVYSRGLPAYRRLSLKNQVELSLERQLYTSGRTGHFVVNAQKVAGEIMDEYGVLEEQISVIHTPIDHGRFSPLQGSKAELRQKLIPGSDLSLPAFIFVSLNHKRKGLEFLLRDWDGVPAELWIVGSPVAGTDLPPNVHTLGCRDDLEELYPAADCFVHPTLYDACANTVLQAMTSGLPSIVSARDGAIEFIEDGVTGLALQNPEEVMQQISRFLGMDEGVRASLGIAAAERMSTLTWEHHLDGWMRVLDCLGSR